jgi:hypothetical protein
MDLESQNTFENKDFHVATLQKCLAYQRELEEKKLDGFPIMLLLQSG